MKVPSLEDDRERRDDVKLTRDLDENVARIKREFEGTETLKSRYIESQKNPGVRCCIFFTDSMISNQIINDNIVRPINLLDMPLATSCIIDVLETKVLQINELAKTSKFTEIVEGIVYGDTVLLAQGCDEALILNTKGWPVRAVVEPEGEKVLQGPREGFNEALIHNLTMLRRRIKTRDLKFKYMVFGRQTKTRACICWIEGIAKREILDELERRLKKVDLDGVLDVNYLSEYIKEPGHSPFKSTGNTERPDVVAAKILEGRVAIFLDGTPIVLTVPYLFIENFQSNEDYYVSYILASFYRFLRILAFFLSTCVPAVYISAVTTQQELLPTPLLLSIAVARQGVPFPTILEVILMWFMFDILRQTGVRISTSVGQTLSIVGALVIGQAAVEAKLFSSPVIIVIAIAGITSLTIPRMLLSILWLRLILLMLAFVLGLYGVIIGLMGMLIYIVDMRSFGLMSFMDPSLKLQEHKDTVMRAPWWMMKTRPRGLSRDNRRSGPEGEKGS